MHGRLQVVLAGVVASLFSFADYLSRSVVSILASLQQFDISFPLDASLDVHLNYKKENASVTPKRL